MKDILIINDFVSKGKIAGNMMATVLASRSYTTYFIPSALISNAFSFGRIASLNTNDYLEESLRVYTDIGFTFDAIFIGYIEDRAQVELIKDFIGNLPYKPLVLLDPIMGDNGKLYKGITDDKIAIYKEAMDLVDIVIANYTEAKFLGIDKFEDLVATDKKYLITSVCDNNAYYNLGISDDTYQVAFEKLDIRLAGTGDLFDALFLHYYIESSDFNKAIETSVRVIAKIIKKQKLEHPHEVDIYIESYLDLIE